MVELRQLRAFVRVTQAGTFTRGAEELHLAQSAVSHAVGRLERELGFELLHRTSRGVERTEAGKLVFERAREVVAGADAIRSDLAALTGLLAGTVALGTMLPPGPVNLPELLVRFHASHPGMPRSTVDGDGPRVAATRIGPPALRRPLTLVWRERRQPRVPELRASRGCRGPPAPDRVTVEYRRLREGEAARICELRLRALRDALELSVTERNGPAYRSTRAAYGGRATGHLTPRPPRQAVPIQHGVVSRPESARSPRWLAGQLVIGD